MGEKSAGSAEGEEKDTENGHTTGDAALPNRVRLALATRRAEVAEERAKSAPATADPKPQKTG